MRLWRNLGAGFGGSAWTAVVGLAVVPIYLRYLGVEAYGLVGFFLALQAIFQILDFGLAPTINREVARCQATRAIPDARNLLHTLATFYWGIAALIAVATIAGAKWIGNDWLQASAVPRDVVVEAVALMGLAIALRFPVGLYIGAMQGAQRIAEASLLSALLSTFGAIGAVTILAFVSPTIEAFFYWHIAVAVAHVGIARWGAWRVLRGTRPPRLDGAWLRRIWRFSAAMGVVSVLGVLLSQLDKLVLSRTVDLAELGRYTLAGLPARSLGLLVAPVFAAIYPRLSAMVASGESEQILALYRNGTRLFLALLLPLAAYVGLFASEILTVWTGDAELSRTVAPVAALLIWGSALNGIMIFPFALQLAYGNSRTPAMIAAALIVGFVPLLLWLVAQNGILGGAVAWLALNAVYIPFGTWLTHRSLLKGEGWNWIIKDVGLPLAVTVFVVGGGGYLWLMIPSTPLMRLVIGGCLIPPAFLLVMALSPPLRPHLSSIIQLVANRLSQFRAGRKIGRRA